MDGYVIFVRFWEHFNDDCPLYQFNRLPDDKLHAAMDQYARDHFVAHKKALGKRYREHLAEMARYAAEERAQYIAPPSGHRAGERCCDLRPERTLTESLKAASFGCRVAWLAEWISQVLPVWGTDDSKHHLCPSRRIPLCNVSDEKDAQNIVALLNDRLPYMEQGTVWPIEFRPRIGCVPGADVTQAEYTASLLAFDDIVPGRPVPWEMVVAKIISDEADRAAKRLGLVDESESGDDGESVTPLASEPTVTSVDAENEQVGGNDQQDTNGDDDESWKCRKRGKQVSDSELPPSRLKAKAIYEKALKEIPGAKDMTVSEIYYAIQNYLKQAIDEADDEQADRLTGFRDDLPPTPESFARYLRDAGVNRYGGDGCPVTRSIRPRTEV